MCRTHEACRMRLFLWTGITSRHDVTWVLSHQAMFQWPDIYCGRDQPLGRAASEILHVGHMPQQNKCEPATVCFQPSLHLIGYEGQLVHWKGACMFIYHCLHMSRQINLSSMPSPCKSFHPFDWMLVISELAKEHLWIAGSRLIFFDSMKMTAIKLLFLCVFGI